MYEETHILADIVPLLDGAQHPTIYNNVQEAEKALG